MPMKKQMEIACELCENEKVISRSSESEHLETQRRDHSREFEGFV
jgi:hypothetical protein